MGNKGWMMVVQAGQVEQIDLLAKGSGLERPDFARKLLAQGLMVERWLQSQGQQNLLGKAEQEAPSLEQVIRPVDGFVDSPSKAKPKATKTKRQLKAESEALEDVPPMLLASINETESSSPSERVADTERPAAASAVVGPTDAELAALPEDQKVNPFDWLNDDPPSQPARDDLDDFAASLLETT